MKYDLVRPKNFSPLPPSSRNRPTGATKTIGSIVRGFKIGVTKWMRQNTPIYNVWQRNYWEHIVRNENELNRIRQYVMDNPAKWEVDRNYPPNNVRVGSVRVVREPIQRYGEESWRI